MPDNVIPYDVYTTQFIDILFELGEDKKAMDIAQKMAVRADSMLEYVLRKDRPDEIEMSTNFAILSQVSAALERAGKKEEANKYKAILDRHYNKIAP
jgi:TPP-dependent 2-oxoacid decarboxylase